MTVQTTLATPNRFSLPSVSGVRKERGVRGQPAPEKNIEKTKVSTSFIVGMEFTPPHSSRPDHLPTCIAQPP